MAPDAADFYVRYYVGHKGKFGHEFLEFELRPDGKVRRSLVGPGPAVGGAKGSYPVTITLSMASRSALHPGVLVGGS